MYRITKSFTFDASHQLLSLPDGHKCKRLHGHTYKTTIELRSESLDEHGFVMDFGELDSIKTYLDTVFDHRHLNSVMPLLEPTAENIAKFLFDMFRKLLGERGNLLYAVTINETPKTSATYYEKSK